MRLLATGSNSHGQLDGLSAGKNLTQFSTIHSERGSSNPRLLFASWSSTVLLTDENQVHVQGHAAHEYRLALQGECHLSSGFGDHNGMIGCLDSNGRVYWVQTDSGDAAKLVLACQSDESSPTLSHIALAGNGKVAICAKQAPNSQMTHIMLFDAFDDFRKWFHDPAEVEFDPAKQHIMLHGRPAQLLANIGSSLLLMEGGEVYSWGDPRYQSLGRSIVGSDAIGPERPGLVEALGGLKIRKIATGGWMSAALSEDHALYLWGSPLPGTQQSITCLKEAGVGEIALVNVDDQAPEPLDVLDVAIGDGHVVVLTEMLRLFVVGDNTNGQTGLPVAESFIEDWTEVTGVGDVQGVSCGPQSTYVLIGS